MVVGALTTKTRAQGALEFNLSSKTVFGIPRGDQADADGIGSLTASTE
jgi:hypothetical protein